MLEIIVFSFHYVVIFQMQEPIDLEENTKSLMRKRQNKLQMDKSKAEEETSEIVATPKN